MKKLISLLTIPFLTLPVLANDGLITQEYLEERCNKKTANYVNEKTDSYYCVDDRRVVEYRGDGWKVYYGYLNEATRIEPLFQVPHVDGGWTVAFKINQVEGKTTTLIRYICTAPASLNRCLVSVNKQVVGERREVTPPPIKPNTPNMVRIHKIYWDGLQNNNW